MKAKSTPAFDLDAPISGGGHEVSLPAGARTDADIDEMFEQAFARSPDSEFLVSIHTWWEEKGFLTKNQYAALCKFTGEDQ